MTVVVLGGGLAGVACAHKLGDEGIEVVLVDRNDYHQFQPLLYQVATSQLPAEDIARPHRTIFREYPSVEVVTAQVEEVSLADRTLRLADGRTFTGSHLVMAAGARPNFFGVPGAAEHAFPLYSVADAERLRLHLQEQVRAARSGAAEDEGTLDVVVVGGGPTGVETTGAVAELMTAWEKTGQTPYRGQVTLVDRGDALLAAFEEKAHHYSLEKLTKAGATIKLEAGVAAVHADRVEFTTAPPSVPTPSSGAAGSPRRPSPRTPGRSRVAAAGSTCSPTSPSTASPACTPSATSPTSPRVTVRRSPSSARSPSSPASGPRRTSCVSWAGPRRSRSTTRTRASWR